MINFQALSNLDIIIAQEKLDCQCHITIMKNKLNKQERKQTMKKVIGIVALMFIGAALISSAQADIKYNMFTNEWERAAQDSQLKYNAFNNDWSFERESSVLEYNPFDNTWGYSK
mgnify:FL=1